jgi:hypothetical protein
MALHEQDREDLLRDGRMMPTRGECLLGGIPVVVGFRRLGQLSLYCGLDPVFQFNSAGQLRRAFCQGQRYAARSGTLVQLRRPSRGGKVELQSIPLEASRQASVVELALQWLARLRQAAEDGTTEWRVIEPQPDEFRRQLSQWFQQSSGELAIASSPHAG